MPDRIREINNRFIEKVGIETTGNAYAKSQIIVLDNKKEPYDVGIYRADEYLYERIDWANSGITTVREAYQERVDEGCRTDLFWRLIGITTTLEPQQGGGGGGGTPTPTPSPSPSPTPSPSPSQDVATNYILECTQLNPTGYEPKGTVFPIPLPPDPFTGVEPPQQPIIYDPNKLYVMDQDSTTASEGGFQSYPLDTKFGLTPEEGENYHAFNVKMEPYSEDLLDPVLATGVGTIRLATNILTFEETQPIDQLQPGIVGIKTGGIINCDSEGIWFENSTFIVSYGTTVVGLGTTTVAGVTTTAGTARKTYVETNDFAMREVNYPEINGTVTNFFILKGPQDINYNKLALKRTSDEEDLSPYTPQRICPLISEVAGSNNSYLIGQGVEVEYTNTGYPIACGEWNKFLDGLPDPANPVEITNDADYEFNIVTEPKVGGGRIWYNEAFTYFPVKENGEPAERGDIRELTRIDTTQTVPSPPLTVYTIYSSQYPNGTCPDLDDNIEDREDDRDAIEDQLADDLANPVSKLSKLYELTNALREERNELNLRIWAFRMQMGQSEGNVDAWDKRLRVINDPDFYDILQTPLSDEERTKINANKGFPTE